MVDIVEQKVLDKDAVRRSVVETPDVQERDQPSAHPLILNIAMASQTITPWGVNFKRRDRELRAFWPGEPWLASVVYLVSIRNASFAWEVIGSDPSKPRPKNTINAVTRMLKRSDRGNGWKKLMLKTCIDLYTTDNGVFWEIIRRGKGPNAPVMNIAHLDSARCLRTGDPVNPVIYTDKNGRERILKYWQVRTIEEFPSPIEEAYDVQYSAVTRCLLAAEIIQSISVYKQEKVGGTFTRAIDAISGITENNVRDAIETAMEQRLNAGIYRYSIPILLASVDPSSKLSHVHIDLASLPDNFDEDTSFKWYVAQLAAAFGVDYQEIAPLMTGNLGSSQQSEIMHLKTRGKGPALIMGLIEDTINGLLPGNVEFQFKEQDLRSESEKANARFTRAKERSLRIRAGELDEEAARQLAVEAGDLPLHMADEIKKRREKEKREQEQQRQEEMNGAAPVEQFSGQQIESGMESQEDRVGNV